MFRYLLNLLLIISLIPGTTFGLEVNGPLNNATMESSSSDPVTGLVEGRFYWNSTSKKPLIYNGTSFQEMGSGGGFGINYLADWSNAGNWTCVGSDLTLTATQTDSELPREHTSGNGIKIIAGSGTQDTGDYCYYDFTLDDIDINRKLNLLFAQKQTGSYVANNYKAFVATQAARTTAIGSPITSDVAAYDGEFNSYGFDTSSTTTLSLVIQAQADMTTSAGIVISDVIVGPGTIQAVPAVGTWQSYTPTFSSGFGTTSLTYAQYKRNTDSIEIRGLFTTGTVTTGAPTVSLPSGLTALIGGSTPLGNWRQAGASTDDFTSGAMTVNVGGTTLTFTDDNSTAASTGTPFSSANTNVLFRSSTLVSFEASFPIAEWAGAPNYAGSNDVEYASVGGTWDSDVSTGTSYSPAGSVMGTGGVLTTARLKVVTWQSDVQVTDKIWLELSDDGVHFYPAEVFFDSSSSAGVYNMQSSTGGATTNSGYRIYRAGTNQTGVKFERYAEIQNDDTPISNWQSTWYWRVVKAKAGAAVGFGHATSDRSGLVKMDSGATTNNVGEYSSTTWATTWTSNGTGGGTSSSVNVKLYRIGNVVTAFIPAFNATTGTGSPSTYTAQTAMPEEFRPATQQQVVNGRSRNNGGASGDAALWVITTSGLPIMFRNASASTFTTSASGGLNDTTTITWTID